MTQCLLNHEPEVPGTIVFVWVNGETVQELK